MSENSKVLYAYKIVKHNEVSYTGLMAIINALGFKGAHNLINTALDFFKSEFEKRANEYPGDAELYDLYKAFILEGATPEEAFERTIKSIKNQMILMDSLNQIGIKHILLS